MEIQNMLASLKSTFDAPPFLGAAIVGDLNQVNSLADRSITIDIDIVQSTIFSLLDSWLGHAWIFATDFAKKELAVALRSATDGFDSVIKLILSGVNLVNDNQIQADISTAVLS